MNVMIEVDAIMVYVHVSLDILVTVVLLELVLEAEQDLVVDQKKPILRHLVSCHYCKLILRCSIVLKTILKLTFRH